MEYILEGEPILRRLFLLSMMRLFEMLDATNQNAPCDYSRCMMRLFEKLHATTLINHKELAAR